MGNQHLTRTWKIRLLTPLHIGDGTELQLNMDYMRTDKGLGVISLEELLQSLSDNSLVLADFGHSSFDLFKFHKDYRVAVNPAYTLKCNPKSVPRSIRSFVKTAFGTPYIPGSTMKGGLRTSLWSQLDRSGLPSPSDYGRFREVVNTIGGNDAHHDFLRPIQISDSHGIEANGALGLEEIKFFNVMRQNKPGWKDFSTRKTSDNFNKTTGVYVETLPAEQILFLRTGIDSLFAEDAVKKAWHLPHCSAVHDFKSLASAINTHSLKMANAEATFFSQFKKSVSGASAFYDKLALEITDISKEPESFIMRIAWGSGWRGMTGNWINSDQLEIVRRENKLGKNGCPYCGSNACWNPSKRKLECKNGACGKLFSDPEVWFHEIFPKTRRLAMKNGLPSIPLGWIAVTPEREDFFIRYSTLTSVSGDAVEPEDLDAPETGDKSDSYTRNEIDEKKGNFQKRLNGIKNLPGEIQPLINAVKTEQDEETQKELCAILLKSAKKLSKGKYKRALKDGKKWANSLANLCNELGVT